MRIRSYNNTLWDPEAAIERPKGPRQSTDHQGLRRPEAAHPKCNCVYAPEEEGMRPQMAVENYPLKERAS